MSRLILKTRGSDAEERTHIALVGFMGAGKTTVGEALARRLGMPFADLDAIIAQEAGMTVADIFANAGEAAFRAQEQALVRRLLLEQTPMVLAMGGGTLMDAPSRNLALARAHTIYLKASVETLWQRLRKGEQQQTRPLLQTADPAATIARLLQERVSVYDLCGVTVSIDTRSVGEIVETIVTELAIAPRDPELTQQVRTAMGSYPIIMRPESGAWLTTAVAEVCPGERLALITDSTVGPLHAAPLLQGLQGAGKQVTLHTVAAGEVSKSWETAGALYEQLLEAEVGRGDALVALGGGVVGDLTGFVASTLLRGVRFVQVPTTTLAAVDSSVGGKTAINTPRGKNLVGTFYSPCAVLLAGAHLQTLPPRVHAAGLVEALKMAACLDTSLYDDIVAQAAILRRGDIPAVLTAIARAVALKVAVVQRDEKEAGERAVLNYGHTIGHAIEAGEGYRMLHGEAVALGMVAEAEWAEREGRADVRTTERITEGVRALEMPVDWRARRLDVGALGSDKKRMGENVRMPVVSTIGTYAFATVPLAALLAFARGR